MVHFGVVALILWTLLPVSGSTSDMGHDRAVRPFGCTIVGTAGNDDLQGTRDDDVICAGDGRDTVHARAGRDVIVGGPAGDHLFGQSGADRVIGGTGSDYLFGGAGDDELRGWVGQDMVFGGEDDDVLSGGPGPDGFSEWEGDNVLYGGAGEDALGAGGGGINRAYGGRGDDVCLQTADERPGDIVVGGPGRDRYDTDPGDVVRSAEVGPACCLGCA